MDLWPRETSMLQVSDNGALLWTSGTKTSPLAWTDTDTSWSPSWESRNRCLYVYGQEVSFYSCHLTVNLIVKCSVENWISFQFYSNIEYFYEYMYWHNIWNLLNLLHAGAKRGTETQWFFTGRQSSESGSQRTDRGETQICQEERVRNSSFQTKVPASQHINLCPLEIQTYKYMTYMFLTCKEFFMNEMLALRF